MFLHNTERKAVIAAEGGSYKLLKYGGVLKFFPHRSSILARFMMMHFLKHLDFSGTGHWSNSGGHGNAVTVYVRLESSYE